VLGSVLMIALFTPSPAQMIAALVLDAIALVLSGPSSQVARRWRTA
jgi:hypothetical protein